MHQLKLNDYNVFCPFNIVSRVKNYIRERERERDSFLSFFNYLTLVIEINY